MSIVLIGLNHNSASVEVRERVSLSKPQIKKYIPVFQGLAFIRGIVVLSTCNRTEFYFSASAHQAAIDELMDFIAQYGGYPVEEIRPYFYCKEDQEAIEHLFTVSAGLDSMILGESQIQGQVQEAYQIALEENISNSTLNTLFMTALSVGKRVRTETQIDRQAVSISSAAVELAKSILGDLHEKTVLILGAGETSELAARHLVSNGISSVIVANRTYERAQVLANIFDGQAIRMDDFLDQLDGADIVISCTASPKYIVNKEDLEGKIALRKNPLLFIDIAVPRDIDPDIKALSQVRLFDIDDLSQVVTKNLLGRKQEAVIAREIVQEELDAFLIWLNSLLAVPTITNLREQAEVIRQNEVEKAFRRIEDITPRERKIIEQLSNSIINQWLHKPMVNLKTLAGYNAEQIHCYLNAITDLFELDDCQGDNYEKTY